MAPQLLAISLSVTRTAPPRVRVLLSNEVATRETTMELEPFKKLLAMVTGTE